MLRFSGSSQTRGSSVLDELQLSNGLLWNVGEETINHGTLTKKERKNLGYFS